MASPDRTFLTVADAHVSAKAPRVTFGKRRHLVVGARPVRRAYLTFRVSTVGEAGRATLALYAFDAAKAGVVVRLVKRPRWRERSITFRNAPKLGPVVGTSGSIQARTWTNVDVTSVVKGDGAYTFVLTTRSRAGIRFASRESASLAPRLIVAPGTVTVGAAGDVACDPSSPHFNNGAGTAANCRMEATSDLLLEADVDGVLVLGDIQYECGRAEAYARSYDPTWGRLKAITRPAIGNHEYGRSCRLNETSPTIEYFGLRNPRGYYSFDLGAWHFLALNSQCTYGAGVTAVGGCDADSPQARWLKEDLARSRSFCTLAYWHEPRFSSGQHGGSQQMAHIWNELVAARVDIVLAGHNHNYERFDPIGRTPAAKAAPDSTTTGTPVFQHPNLDAEGIRQFIVGTGGRNVVRFRHRPLRGEAVRNDDTFGVLVLTLHPTSYAWKFVPEPGKEFTDSGSGVCH